MTKYLPYAMFAFMIFMMWMMIKMGKTMTMQTTLLIGMASKLGVLPEGKRKEDELPDTTEHEHTPVNNPEESEEDLDDETIIREMGRISEVIVSKTPLTIKDEKYYKRFIDEMHEDMKLQPASAIIAEPKKDAPKRLDKKEKASLMQGIFSDNKPRQLHELAHHLANLTNTKYNEGNTSGVMQLLIKDKKVKTVEIKLDKKQKAKKFFGLTEWFDGKKMKEEFSKNISKN